MNAAGLMFLSSLAMARPSTATSFQIVGEGASRSVRLRLTCGETVVATTEGVGTLTVHGEAHRGEGHCTAHFSGPLDASFAPVVPGWEYACRMLNKDVYCNAVDHLGVASAPSAPSSPSPSPKMVARVTPDAAGKAGPITVSLSEPDLALWGLLVCPGGETLRAQFDKGTAVFDGAPDEDCIVSLKGGRPGRFAGVRPGESISCAPIGPSLRCHYPLDKAITPTPKPASVRAPVTRTPSTKPAGVDELVVHLTDPALSSWVAIHCPSGHRSRADFVAGRAVLEGVPDEKCTVSFKGGSPARFDGVSRGMNLQCSISGTVATCTH